MFAVIFGAFPLEDPPQLVRILGLATLSLFEASSRARFAARPRSRLWGWIARHRLAAVTYRCCFTKLGHSFVPWPYAVIGRSITLFRFGGVANPPVERGIRQHVGPVSAPSTGVAGRPIPLSSLVLPSCSMALGSSNRIGPSALAPGRFDRFVCLSRSAVSHPGAAGCQF